MECIEYTRRQANADLERIMFQFPKADSNLAARMVLTAIDTFKESIERLPKAEIQRRFLETQDAPAPIIALGQDYVNGKLSKDATKLILQSIFDQYKAVYRGYL